MSGHYSSFPGLAMFGAILCVLVAVYSPWAPSIFGGLTLAIGAMFLNIVPCYTIISSVTMPNMRGVGCGVALAAVNLLGAIWSPTLMGWVADTFGQRDAMATGFGQALERLGARPAARPGLDPQNLTAAMLVVVPALLIAGSVLLAGSRHLPREMALWAPNCGRPLAGWRGIGSAIPALERVCGLAVIVWPDAELAQP